MPLQAGDKLGPYEILAPLGAGGMGEVYRARDTKLEREVAIKILPEALARDPARLARFEREAKVLAALNHPNIAAIYGVEDRALVMELVQGETLKGPLPVETALHYAKQIADALEAAHEKGIVHRDLKPANIMITPEGVVKVLDFGLATAVQGPASDARDDPANSPTLTMGVSQSGMILGTAGYMSPEQASGRSVDKRADIWAYGVVLWEMLTGPRLFDGETISHTLADVLRGEIDFDKLPAGTPRAIRELLRRCLDRNVKNRLRDIGEARVAIENAGKEPEAVAAAVSIPRRSMLPWAAGAVALAVAAAVLGVGWWRATRPVDRPLVRLSVDLGPDAIAGVNTTAAISPDGTQLVFLARGPDGRQQLATRRLDQAAPTLMRGTENARDPFFSPDGQWIGFFADSKLKKISVQGGAPVILCDAVAPIGASWGEDGAIIAALSVGTGLSRVPAAGGAPQPIARPEHGALTLRYPQIIPGSSAVLFTASQAVSPSSFDRASIEALSLKTGERKTLAPDGYFGRFLPTGDPVGHLIYIQQGALFGVAFDPTRLEVRGAPAPLLEDVAAQIDFSRTGTFLYGSGKRSAQNWPVVWLDSSGKTQPLIATPGVYNMPRFSPDGRLLALSVDAGKGPNIYVYDWQRDTMSPLTFSGINMYPIWMPDGKHLVFRSASSSQQSGIGWIRADGAGEPQRLLEGGFVTIPTSFSPDGRRLAYYDVSQETRGDIWTLPLDLSDPEHPKPGKPEPFLRTPASETRPAFSPDGRWIAYQSDESGRYEVYVRPFPGPGGKRQVSAGGGANPIWSRDGRQLFFTSLDNRIMVASATVEGESFLSGKPRLWSPAQIHQPTVAMFLDLAPDGKRFAVFPMPEAKAEEKGSVHVTFLLNFFDEVRRRAPVSDRSRP